MLSLIIPSRKERWLTQTINELLSRAEGEVEIIVGFDGVSQELPDDPRIKSFLHGDEHKSIGMRDTINKAVEMAEGEYIMKIDGHCMVGPGYDLKLIADCQDDWVVVPRRYRLDVDKWEIIEDGRPPVDYMFVAYPYERPGDMTCGLHGDIWKIRDHEELIDDLMTFQGSCYFMKKSYWVPLDSSKYGPFTHESQEISMRAWLSGGRVVVNKKTWYAHLHKGKQWGTGYGFSNAQWKAWGEDHEKGRVYAIDYWLTTQDYEHDFEWLINKFWNFSGDGIPTWPADWKTKIVEDEKYDFRHTDRGKSLLQSGL